MDLNEIIIEYNSSGRIARLIFPDKNAFEVTRQTDIYVQDNWTSSILNNNIIEEGETYE